MTRRDTAVFIGLLALIFLLSLLSNASTAGEADDLRSSSFLTSPGGAGALFLVLDELGIPVERRLTSLVDLDTLSGTLAILAPSEIATPAEVAALMAWVEGGGTLLYAARPRDPVVDTLGLGLVSLMPNSFAALRAWEGEIARPLVHPITDGVTDISGFRFAFQTPRGTGSEPLLATDEDGIVAVRLEVGTGLVFAFSDVAPLVNANLGEGGAALLFARAAREGGGRITFDEYHHGFRDGGTPWDAMTRFLFGTRPGFAVVHLAVAALGLLLLLGTRFGAALPAPAAERRNPLEHVDALAAAYRRAGARRTARTLLLNGLARRLGRLQPGVQADAIFESVRRSSMGEAAQAATELESEWGKGDAADLVAVARHMDEILEGR